MDAAVPGAGSEEAGASASCLDFLLSRLENMPPPPLAPPPSPRVLFLLENIAPWRDSG